MKRILSAVVLTLASMLVATGCSMGTAAGPQATARDAFEVWAQRSATPYKDVSYTTLNNDGTYAIVRITAWLRENAQSEWLEYQSNVECRKVGGEWQAPMYLDFTLTPAEETRQRAQREATATAQSIEREVTATAQSMEREAKAILLDSIEIANGRRGDFYKPTWRVFEDVPAEVTAPGIARVVVQIKNPDSRDHQVRIRFYLRHPPDGDGYEPSPGPAEVDMWAKAGTLTEQVFQLDFSDWRSGIEPGEPVGCVVQVLDAN